MKTFIQACLDGNAKAEDVDDWIDDWHNSDSKLDLHEYLGMTWVEYVMFIKNSSYLHIIINMRKLDKKTFSRPQRILVYIALVVILLVTLILMVKVSYLLFF